jgi:hypothetical protein
MFRQVFPIFSDYRYHNQLNLSNFASSFVVATYIQVRLTPQDFACLPQAGAPCIRAFLISLQKMTFSTGS